MIVDRLTLRLLRLPLIHPFETSFARETDREFIIVEAAGDGPTGYGECVAEANPYYTSETSVTAWHVIEQFIAPRLLGRAIEHPRDIFPSLAAIRGHHMAKAGVEMACWDLYARQRNEPLAAVLGGTRAEIASGVSIGIQESPAALLVKIETELADHYRRVKIKIKPGWDVEIVQEVRRVFPDLPLMVDANAAYTLEDAVRLARLDADQLMMIEQPLSYDDLLDHAELQRRLATPICLDESIHSERAARDALALGACRIINIKPGRVGGHGQSIRIHDLTTARGVPVWCGGMLESGIGRAHNIHLASLPNFSLPGDIAASKRYYKTELIDPPVEMSERGTIPVPRGAGLGFTVLTDRLRALTLRESVLTRSLTV